MERAALSIVRRILVGQLWRHVCVLGHTKSFYHSSVAVEGELAEKSSGWHMLPPFSGLQPLPYPPVFLIQGQERAGPHNTGSISSKEGLKKFRTDKPVVSAGEKDLECIAGGQPLTAARWVHKCCQGLPYSLVRKLFRKRQVRMVVVRTDTIGEGEAKPAQAAGREYKLQKVKADEELPQGAVLCLPGHVLYRDERAGGESAEKHAASKHGSSSLKTSSRAVEHASAQLRSSVLYKDDAVIVVNKPPGLAVQGGSKVTLSLDNLLSALSYGSSETPRLVHRLDRETSGALVIGRTHQSTRILHALFRHKTSSAAEETPQKEGIQRRYWALVSGGPSRKEGRISAPLAKVVLPEGRGDRIVLARTHPNGEAQHAVTEYSVLSTASAGAATYTWLELRPVTGRKHQLRVHCAEVLGLPIVGDFKYGWKAPPPLTPQESIPPRLRAADSQEMQLCETAEGASEEEDSLHDNLRPHEDDEESVASVASFSAEMPSPYSSLGAGRGGVCDSKPGLHLHCRELSMPRLLPQEDSARISDSDPSRSSRIEVVAPLPAHMARSWIVLGFSLNSGCGERERERE